MTVWHLTAFPLSPIHVGDGATWTLDAFKLDGEALCRFSPAAVLDAMAPEKRAAYIRLLDQGQLKAAQQALRQAVRSEHIVERIALSSESREELANALDNPRRSGEVHGFIRTAGRPYLPGSSVKGALRTALLSARANEMRPVVEAALERERNQARKSDALQTTVLETKPSATEQDPFRFLKVSDAPLPENATRVDRVYNWSGRRGTESRRKIQMHFERLLTVQEDHRIAFPVEIAVDADFCAAVRARDRQAAKTPRKPFDAETLWNAANAFYWRRLKAELENSKFFQNEKGTKRFLMPLLEKPPVGFADDGPPNGSPWLLLRIGRFTHFESKSVDGFRAGWNAQAKRPMKEGSTRAIVKHADFGGAPIPFGWLLLYRGDPKDLGDAFPPRVEARPQARPEAHRQNEAGKKAFLDGEPVEIITQEGDEVCVRFPDGDTEWVSRDDLEWK